VTRQHLLAAAHIVVEVFSVSNSFLPAFYVAVKTPLKQERGILPVSAVSSCRQCIFVHSVRQAAAALSTHPRERLRPPCQN